MAIDVQDLDAKVSLLSGHRDETPTGIVPLWEGSNLRANVSDQYGGEMIDFVYEQSASWKELPVGNLKLEHLIWRAQLVLELQQSIT